MRRDGEFISLDDGRLTVAAEFSATLRAAGLDTFDKVMALSKKNVIRAVPGRSTVRLELPSLVVYLKRYKESYLSCADRLCRLLHWPGADDEAAREWRNILSLRQHGFLTATPIALGQRHSGGVVTASFVMQQEISGGFPGDEYLLQRLANVPLRRKWALLDNLGKLARAFQHAGFIHKDFYLKHIFIVERGADWDLHLIDLQRVDGPRRHRRRWFLKDLGALAHSAQARAKLSRTSLLRLYLAFADVKRLGPADKRKISQIWQRVLRIRRRPPKYRRVWDAQ